jgi:preprotein translocase subunit SecE
MLEKISQAPGRLLSFYSDVKTELKKVTWPGKKEVYGTTLVVVIAVIFFGLYLFLVDLVLKAGVDELFAFFR